MDARYIISLETGEKHEILLNQPLTVGREKREEGNFIFIDRKGISRNHGVITFTNRGLYLLDEGSKNGTMLNGKTIANNQEYDLKNGDSISFAGEQFLVEFSKKEKDFIRIGNLYGEIEEIGGRRGFSYVIKNSQIFEYEKRILSMKDCPSVLQVSFMKMENEERITYDFTGYCPLEEFIRLSMKRSNSDGENRNDADGALKIILNILYAIKECGDYLLMGDRLPLLMETIFIDISTDKVSFAYVPSLLDNTTLQERLIDLFEKISAFYYDGELNPFIAGLKKGILEKNPGVDGIITMVASIQRELNFNYWSRQCLRKDKLDDLSAIEEKEDPDFVKTKDSSHIKSWINDKRAKLFFMQIGVVIGLISIYFSGIFDSLDFVGFFLIVLGLDLWIVKSLKNEKV